MKTLIIGANSVRRMLRERSNIFFVFILPMLLILVLGAVFGGQMDPRVGVVGTGGSGPAAGVGASGPDAGGIGGGGLGEKLAAALESAKGLDARQYDGRESLILAVERGRLDAGLVIPSTYDADLRAGRGATVEYVSRRDATAQALRGTVESIISEQGSLARAAAFASQKTGMTYDQALAKATQIAGSTPGLAVQIEATGDTPLFAGLGRFDMGAYSELLLFVFLTSLAGSAALIQSRQLGVSRRMLSTPTPVRTILGGEAIGRFAVALVQGLFIMLGSALAFGVDWGNPFGAALIMIVFSLGAAATGMLMGAVFRNDQQAGGLGVLIGLGLAALGGCMLPLAVMKIFSPTMWKVAHITPHAWGIEAFEDLILRKGTVADILPELGILLGFAVLMFALAAWRLRATLTRA